MSLEINTDPLESDRRDARARASREAHQGVDPYVLWGQEDVDWAFEGHEDELERLRGIAAEVVASRQRAAERRAAFDRLHEATLAVLREWDEREKAERFKRAQDEAKRRIDWEQPA